MGITKKIKFVNQEKTSMNTTTSSTYVNQGTLMDASKLVAGNKYLMIMWVNCVSPGAQEGKTKFAWEGGAGDLVGSEYQRHDTNSSGMQICHIAEVTAPDPTENLGVYRQRTYSDGHNEQTNFGQCFAIDLSYSGPDGGMTENVDWSSSVDSSTRTPTPNTYFQTHTVDNTSGTNLVVAIAKAEDAVGTSDTLIGLYKNYTAAPAGPANVLIASGSKFTQDTESRDRKSIVFAAATDLNDGSQIKLRSLDSHNLTIRYSYIFTLNIDENPENQATGQLTTWNDFGGRSGSLGSVILNGASFGSFVIAMRR